MKAKEYFIYYEIRDYVLCNFNKLAFYTENSKEYVSKIKEMYARVEKIYFSNEDIQRLLRNYDKDFIYFEIQTKNKTRYKVKEYFKEHYKMFKDDNYIEEVIRCGIIPIRHIPRRLP